MLIERIHLFPAYFVALLLGLAALLLAAGPGEGSTLPILSVRSTVLVDAARVDASSLLGPEASPDLRQKLERIQMGVITKPLGEITLQRDELTGLLGPLSESFQLPSRIRFRRRGDLLNGKDIIEGLRKLCLERFSDVPEDQIEINFRYVPSHLVLPGSLVDWHIEPLSTQRLGMLLFSLEANSSGGTVRKVIQVDVARVIEAAKVSKLIKRGQIIGSEDVRPHKVRLRTDHERLPVALTNVLGRAAATIKSPGSVIREQDLTSAPSVEMAASADGSATISHRSSESKWLVAPGDKVDFSVHSSGLRLVVPARAVQGGNVGEEIKLINLQNQRSISGVITDSGKVEFHAQ